MSEPFERRRLRVYVAGPLTQGPLFENVAMGVKWGRQMLQDGLAPYVPHLDAFMLMRPDEVSWNAYLEWDLEWSTLAEAVFRIDGESRGADLEVRMALQHDVPVFYEKPARCYDHDCQEHQWSDPTCDHIECTQEPFAKQRGYEDLLKFAAERGLDGRRK